MNFLFYDVGGGGSDLKAGAGKRVWWGGVPGVRSCGPSGREAAFSERGGSDTTCREACRSEERTCPRASLGGSAPACRRRGGDRQIGGGDRHTTSGSGGKPTKPVASRLRGDRRGGPRHLGGRRAVDAVAGEGEEERLAGAVVGVRAARRRPGPAERPGRPGRRSPAAGPWRRRRGPSRLSRCQTR